jgi:hypothetical protein
MGRASECVTGEFRIIRNRLDTIQGGGFVVPPDDCSPNGWKSIGTPQIRLCLGDQKPWPPANGSMSAMAMSCQSYFGFASVGAMG